MQKRWEMISTMGINVGDHMKKQHDEHWYRLLWEPGEGWLKMKVTNIDGRLINTDWQKWKFDTVGNVNET